MPLSVGIFACCLAASPASAASPAGPGSASQPAPGPVVLPALVFVAAEGLDAPALEAEIAMRMPELRVTRLEGTPPDEPFMYIQARREGGRVHRVAIIFSDGRAFYEHFDVGDAGSPERVVASSIANLLFSIESGAVAPDQHDVAAPIAKPKPEPEPEPEPEPPAEPEPEPEREPEPPAEPRLEIGFGLGLGQLSALGPPRFGDAHLGVFGALELDLRTRRGLFVALGFRPGGASGGGYRLTRLRTELGLGYAWRGPRIELVIATTAALGPWLVSSEGRAEPIRALDDGALGQPPLLAFGLRLSPGYHVELDRGALRSLRVGPRVEASGGFVTTAEPRVAGLQSTSGQELFRLGGVELYAGLELVLWFARELSAATPRRGRSR